jgi:phosphoglycolate phosphatase-like HAD superfamily hydrolase
MIRNIIWDVDGTIFDTYPAFTTAFERAMTKLGADVPSDWILAAAKISLSHCASALANRCQLEEAEIAHEFIVFYDQASPAEQPPFPGVLEICQHICALGGKNVIVTHRESEGLVELLAVHNLTSYFSGWITRDDGYPKKPDPSAFVAALNLHQLPPAETLAVGDRDIDTFAARSAGLFTCQFDPQNPATPADLSISSFGDLYRYLKENQQSSFCLVQSP